MSYHLKFLAEYYLDPSPPVYLKLLKGSKQSLGQKQDADWLSVSFLISHQPSLREQTGWFLFIFITHCDVILFFWLSYKLVQGN